MIVHDCCDLEEMARHLTDITSERPLSFKRFLIPKEVLETTQKLLWRKGRRGLEELNLWSGWILEDATCLIATVIQPDTTSWLDFVEISDPLESASIGNLVAERGQLITAQIHSHPGLLTIPSHADLMLPFCMLLGFIHVIVPHYGRQLELADCGIYETVDQSAAGAVLRRIRPGEAKERFRIVRLEDLDEVLACHIKT